MILTLGWQMPLWLPSVYITAGVEKSILSHDDAVTICIKQFLGLGWDTTGVSVVHN
jgi:hypothetical protein